MDKDMLDVGHAQYLQALGYDDVERDADGFIILRPTADTVDERVETLTTNIDTLEEKLKALRKSKSEAVAYQKTDEYKADKKKSKGKKKKKERERLINMVFNNADQQNAELEAEEEEKAKTAEKEGKKPSKKKSADTTLDTTFGKRFSPVVSMLYDSIQDFDQIAEEIRTELDSTQGRTKGMYRSSQMSNLLSAKKNKFDAIKYLGDLSKSISDLEMKKEKEKKAEEGSDNTKALSNLAAKYLRGSYDADTEKKKKKGKSDKRSSFEKTAKSMGYDPDDDDEPKRKKDLGRDEKDQALAKEFAKALEGRSDEFSFTPYEKHLDMEGKYTFVVVCDPLDPEHTWDFMAIDPKSGKELNGFRKEYKDLMPRKKSCRMRFDINKKKATDMNSSRTYKMIFQ